MSIDNTEKDVILIVDDTLSNLQMLFDFLEDAGFKVLVAEDGESAIEMAQYAPPDLILLDVFMPKMDGFETCHRLKTNQTTQDIPVIFLTASSEKVDKVKGLKLGAVDYITKPLEHEEVLARVNIHLHLRNLTKRLIQQNQRLEVEISERKQAEQKIREQAALLDITTDAILVQNLDNQIQFWNLGAEHLYGWKIQEALGKNANELLYRQETLSQLANIQISLVEKSSWQGELHQITKEGKAIIVASRWTLMRDEDGQPKSILIVNTDITEKKLLEAQFLRVQRLESIGTLASGIAHDLNNALTPMLLCVQLLEKKLLDQQSQEWLSILKTNIKRGANLIKQVLSFARGVEGDRTTVQVNKIISEIEHITKQTFPKAIEIRTHATTQNLWAIYANATQLHQVLMNLCVNARDAMPYGGIIEISAKNFWIDTHYARMNIEAKMGPYVVITVSDTGVGIRREIIDQVFEPFFTTKEVGKGTGLGLSTVIGIVRSYGGFIKVYSEVEKGTKFKVYLPAMLTTEVDSFQREHHELPIVGHGEFILVVDDEDFICEMTKSLLENYGYNVLVAKDGTEAIALYEQHQEKIHVVIIDMMMPSMDGSTTVRVLKTINPEVKIIGVSGLVLTSKMVKIFGNSVKTFLPKPYTSDELLKKLQFVLSSK
ncbi:hybrid sensor histidine kinase/response regulator [Nostocales cyanobacterium HT-58-2]|nr:hybrid sensor histidine kinase/response regulator [Nostocales cyanobacterium HT-58-2]